jgi:biopolymer transport protein ExbB/TolQ
MHTYLVVCGIIFNVLVFLLSIGGLISEISARKINKKTAAEKARKDALYKEELKVAEQAWQKWAKKMDEIQQNYEQETNPMKRLRITTEEIKYKFERHYFASIDESLCLNYLGTQNNWVRKE